MEARAEATLETWIKTQMMAARVTLGDAIKKERQSAEVRQAAAVEKAVAEALILERRRYHSVHDTDNINDGITFDRNGKPCIRT